MDTDYTITDMITHDQLKRHLRDDIQSWAKQYQREWFPKEMDGQHPYKSIASTEVNLPTVNRRVDLMVTFGPRELRGNKNPTVVLKETGVLYIEVKMSYSDLQNFPDQLSDYERDAEKHENSRIVLATHEDCLRESPGKWLKALRELDCDVILDCMERYVYIPDGHLSHPARMLKRSHRFTVESGGMFI